MKNGHLLQMHGHPPIPESALFIHPTTTLIAIRPNSSLPVKIKKFYNLGISSRRLRDSTGRDAREHYAQKS
jgi:hypothetical protein